jgi:hypothetical protein
VALAGLNRLQEAEDALVALAKNAPAGYLAEAVHFTSPRCCWRSRSARRAMSVLDDARKNKGLTAP